VATDLCREHDLTDGVVSLRPPLPGDAKALVEGRDDEFFKWLGPGTEEPNPFACIWAGDQLVGWIDYDVERDWLAHGEVNVGYYLFPAARGKGYASRAVELLLLYLDRETEYEVATLLIHGDNGRSLRLARRLGFEAKGEVEGDEFFVRRVSRRDSCTRGSASSHRRGRGGTSCGSP
jgi:RimJ/RimL family protein N-acetyltransferase